MQDKKCCEKTNEGKTCEKGKHGEEYACHTGKDCATGSIGGVADKDHGAKGCGTGGCHDHKAHEQHADVSVTHKDVLHKDNGDASKVHHDADLKKIHGDTHAAGHHGDAHGITPKVTDTHPPTSKH